MQNDTVVSRRGLLAGGVALGGLAALQPAWARTTSHGVSAKGFVPLAGDALRLVVAESRFPVDGTIGHAVTINGTLPAPLVRLFGGKDGP